MKQEIEEENKEDKDITGRELKQLRKRIRELEDEVGETGTLLRVGDIQVVSNSIDTNLDKMKTFVSSLLKDKKISNYLSNEFPKKKLFGGGSWVG